MEGHARARLASVEMRLGDLDAARDQAEAAVSLSRESGAWKAEGLALMCLGGLSFFTGDAEGALDKVRAALKQFRKEGDRREEGRALLRLGSSSLAQGNLASARRSSESSLVALKEAAQTGGAVFPRNTVIRIDQAAWPR